MSEWQEKVFPEGPGWRHHRRAVTGPEPTVDQIRLITQGCPPQARLVVEGEVTIVGWLTREHPDPEMN